MVDVVKEPDNIHIHYKVQFLQLRHFIALSNGVLRRPVRSEPIVSLMEFSLTYWFEYLQYALLNQSVPYARYSEWSHFAVILWDLGSSYPSWLIVSQLVSYFSDYLVNGEPVDMFYSLSVRSWGLASSVFADISVRQHYVLFRDYHFHQVLEALSVFTVIVKFTQLFLQAVPVYILF